MGEYLPRCDNFICSETGEDSWIEKEITSNIDATRRIIPYLQRTIDRR